MIEPYYKDDLGILYCGDCLEILPQIPNKSVNLIVTSPPYNKHSAKRKCGITDTWKKANIDYGIYGDDMPEKKYQRWQKEVLRECLRTLCKNGSIFYNHKSRVVNHGIIFPTWVFNFNVRQIIIWNRGNTPQVEDIRFYPITEYVIWITPERKTPKFNRNLAKHKTEVWNITPRIDPEHPATFPLDLVNNCILPTTNENDLVLDPFIGSGTTAVACKMLNRRWVGIEINPKYCDLTIQHLKAIPDSLFKDIQHNAETKELVKERN